MKKKEEVLPMHVSPARRIWADVTGSPFYPLKDLQEARKYHDAVMIFEGDSGGQIYLVSPVKNVKCSIDSLNRLFYDLDMIAWPSNDHDEMGIFYERRRVGEGIAGGMGGGVVVDGLWLHEEFNQIKGKIEGVLSGKRSHL